MAIRKAADNPNGNQPLKLPLMNDIESLHDPKKILYDLLRAASGHVSRRRLDRLSVRKLAFRVIQSTSSFMPLLKLAAFRNLEEELLEIIAGQNWNS
ncbi:MAG TPA: hypothetical protein ENK96_02110 [Desulfobulbaceae bacterium]|nr:hypothetical protein [Desulfobulbaceae bacterium]